MLIVVSRAAGNDYIGNAGETELAGALQDNTSLTRLYIGSMYPHDIVCLRVCVCACVLVRVRVCVCAL